MKERGQVTIFIILGVALVAGAAVLFAVFSNKAPSLGGQPGPQNMNAYLSTCLQSDVQQGVEALSLEGGSINNSLSTTFQFSNTTPVLNISYLCYTAAFNSTPCNPPYLLYPFFENNLHDYLSKDVSGCFDSLVSTLKSQGYQVASNYNGFEVYIMPNRIYLNISADVTTNKSSTQRYDSFQAQVPSEVYNMLSLTNDLINQESMCNLTVSYIFNYPNYQILWYGSSDQSNIFHIVNRQTQEQFNFAVRSCAVQIG